MDQTPQVNQRPPPAPTVARPLHVTPAQAGQEGLAGFLVVVAAAPLARMSETARQYRKR
jgi:hypothetical protein